VRARAPRRAGAALLAAAALLAGAGGAPASAERHRSEPVCPGRAWASAPPERLGYDAAALDDALRAYRARGATAAMVIASGRVIASRGDLALRINAHSIRKSLTSALYGLAVSEGRMDLDATLGELGIEAEPGLTPRERSARVRDLLTARSGVYLDAAAETPFMAETRPARGSRAPGERFYYNNFDFNVLETIYLRATEEPIGEAFHRRVARPVGMRDFRPGDVFAFPSEVLPGPLGEAEHEAHQYLISTRDLARFALLYAREGDWCGRRVLPAAWVRESTRPHARATWRPQIPPSGYGYLWWVTNEAGRLYPGARPLPVRAFGASGFGGQNLAVLPALELVVVARVDTGRSLPGFLWWYAFGDRLRDGDFVELLHDVLAARRPAAPGGARAPTR